MTRQTCWIVVSLEIGTIARPQKAFIAEEQMRVPVIVSLALSSSQSRS
jgi:hypothetical protein